MRNTFQHDARVTREALTLTEHGLAVVIFALAATEEDVGTRWQGPLLVERITLDTPIRRFTDALLEFTRFWHRIARLPRRLSRGFARVWFALRLPRDRLAERLSNRFPLGRTASVAISPLNLLARAVAPQPPDAVFPTYAERYKGRPPVTVRSVDAARRWIRDAVWPAHLVLQTLRFGRRAGAMAAGFRPVAYHCHDFNTLLAGHVARRRWPAPVIYDAHELWPHRRRSDAGPLKTWISEQADRFLSRRSDAVITVNESIARHLEQRYGLSDVVVLRNTPAAAKDPGRGSPLDTVPHPRLLYVGYVKEQRGTEELVDALALLPEVQLVLMGPGTPRFRASLEARAERTGVFGRVHFLPPVPHDALIPAIGSADLGFALIKNYCLSYYLSLPNKFFEYLHAGLPIVASNFPEMGSLIERYGVGVTCDPSDPEAIAKAVNDLLSQPEELERMRSNALAAARELTWEHESERLLALYRRLVSLPLTAVQKEDASRPRSTPL